jgi:hypothetical protein
MPDRKERREVGEEDLGKVGREKRDGIPAMHAEIRAQQRSRSRDKEQKELKNKRLATSG